MKDYFWSQFIDTAVRQRAIPSGRKPVRGLCVTFSAGVKGLTWGYQRLRGGTRVNLHIYTDRPEENARLFGRLHARRIEVEERFGGPLEWRFNDPGASIQLDLPLGSHTSGPEEWPRAHEEMIDAMQRLRCALEPELGRL